MTARAMASLRVLAAKLVMESVKVMTTLVVAMAVR